VIFIKRFLLPFILCISSTVFAQSQLITLHTGDVYIIHVEDIERVAIGNEKVVQYRPLENGELLLTAGELGVSDVHLWTKGDRQRRYAVRVIAESISGQLQAARKIANSVMGLKVTEVDNKLIFSGLLNRRDVDQAGAILGFFPGALSLVKFRDFDKEPMVRLDVKVLEVNSSVAKDLGIDWQKTINGPSFAVHKAFDPSITGGAYLSDPNSSDYLDKFIGGWPSTDSNFYSFGSFTSAFTSRINLLAENGDANVLASPKLSVKSGETADFHSGGEFPIPYRGVDGQMSVMFKEYGIKLNITPILDAEGIIDTSIYTEVSSIDFANEVLGVPGVTTRNTKTRINLLNGETLVISGLAYAESSKSTSKVPFLGDIPFFGRLFRKNDTRLGTKELIISVTPIIISAESERNRSLLDIGDKFAEKFKDSGINQALME